MKGPLKRFSGLNYGRKNPVDRLHVFRLPMRSVHNSRSKHCMTVIHPVGQPHLEAKAPSNLGEYPSTTRSKLLHCGKQVESEWKVNVKLHPNPLQTNYCKSSILNGFSFSFLGKNERKKDWNKSVGRKKQQQQE